MKKNSSSSLIGKQAETLAVDFLQNKGWSIIKTNYKADLPHDNRVRYGEIDIIAELITESSKLLVAFEVKKRKAIEYLYHAINLKQQQRIQAAFLHFISNNIEFKQHDLRFDAILIHNNKINHIENAWFDVQE